MPSLSHEKNATIASSTPGAARMSAAIRQGKIEISDPIPITRVDVEGTRPQTKMGHPRYPPIPPPTKADTKLRRRTLPSYQAFDMQGGRRDPATDPSAPYDTSKWTSSALTARKQSCSSLPFGVSGKKVGGLRATLRRIFGSKNERGVSMPSVQAQGSLHDPLINDTESTSHRLRMPFLMSEELIRGRALNSHPPSPTSSEPVQNHNSRANPIHPILSDSKRRNSFPSAVRSPQEAERVSQDSNEYTMTADSKVLHRPLRRMSHKTLIDAVKYKFHSADTPRDMAESQTAMQAQERCLSEGIKYRQNSTNEDSIPTFSNNPQEVHHANDTAADSQTATTVPPARIASDNVASHSQGFDFRDFVLGDGEASVEQRIATVEVKLSNLESAIANLQGYKVAQAVYLGNDARRRKASLVLD